MRKPVHLINKLSSSSNAAWVLAGDVTRVFPEAKAIGSGFFRTAYRIGDYVVKAGHSSRGRPRKPPKQIRLSGMLLPQHWNVNGWEVQPYYRLASNRLIDKFLDENPRARKYYMTFGTREDFDLGYGNTGIDDKGRLVCFDW